MKPKTRCLAFYSPSSITPKEQAGRRACGPTQKGKKWAWKSRASQRCLDHNPVIRTGKQAGQVIIWWGIFNNTFHRWSNVWRRERKEKTRKLRKSRLASDLHSPIMKANKPGKGKISEASDLPSAEFTSVLTDQKVNKSRTRKLPSSVFCFIPLRPRPANKRGEGENP